MREVKTRSDINHQIRKFKFFYFISKFNLYTPFFALYLEKVSQLSNNEILLLFSVFSISVFLLEVPTGLISDRFGEKQSLVVGSVILVLATVFLTFGNFWLVVVAEIFFALSLTFFSGSSDALLYNYYQKYKECLKDENNYDKIQTDCISNSWLAVALASLTSYGICLFDLSYVFYGSILVSIVTLLVALSFPNLSIKRQNDVLEILNLSIVTIIKTKRLLFWIIVSSFFFAILIAGYFILQPYLNESNFAGSSNGLLYFCITAFAFISSKYTNEIQKVFKNDHLLLFLTSLILAGVFYLFSQANSLIFLFFIACAYRFFWGYLSPLFIKEINHIIESDQIRSSILSINSLLSNLFCAAILFLSFTFFKNSKVSYLFLSICVLGIGMVTLFGGYITNQSLAYYVKRDNKVKKV